MGDAGREAGPAAGGAEDAFEPRPRGEGEGDEVLVGQLLDLRVRDAAECKTVQTTALRKVDEVSEKIRQLKAIRDVLTELADTCAGDGRTSECPILKAMDSDPE